MRFPIRMRLDRELRDDIENLKQILVPVSGSSNQMQPAMNANQKSMANKNASMAGMNGGTSQTFSSNVESSPEKSSLLNSTSGISKIYLPLSYLADIKISTGPPMISSENGMLRSIVFMNARGRDMGSVVDDAKKQIEEKLKLPAGYSYTWSGQYENKIRAQQTITIIMPVVFLLIFFLLYFTFKDYK
jgi:Cu/Ag efflux pump CusA